MIEGWGLPDYLGTIISGHHHEGKPSEVEAAIRLVGHLRDNNEMDGTDRSIESCREESGLEPDTSREMIGRAFEEAEKRAQLLQ